MANFEWRMLRTRPPATRLDAAPPRILHSSFPTRHSSGFTLIECLVYISLFAMFIVLAMTTFYRSRDGSDALRRNADDITRALHAGERWREDVRTATAPPRVFEENGQHWLTVLRGTNMTVYTHFKDTVWRQEHTNAAWQPALARLKASAMSADARAHVAAWRWEVELQLRDPRKQTKPLYTFLAVAPNEPKP